MTFDQQKKGLVILTNSSNGEGIFKELLETLLGDTFTPIESLGYGGLGIGLELSELLESLIRNRQPEPRDVVLPTRLIPRESCGC